MPEELVLNLSLIHIYTDSIRHKKAEKYIEDKVSERLVELENETLKKFEDELEASLLTEQPNDTFTSSELAEKVKQLEQRLNRFKELEDKRKNKYDSEDGIRSQLKECLLKNKGKPLNCYEEMKQFNKLVQNQS